MFIVFGLFHILHNKPTPNIQQRKLPYDYTFLLFNLLYGTCQVFSQLFSFNNKNNFNNLIKINVKILDFHILLLYICIVIIKTNKVMANLCDANFRLVGNKENVKIVLDAIGQVNNLWCGRGIDYVGCVDMADIDADTQSATIYGAVCKWSIQSCLYDNANDMKLHPEMWYGIEGATIKNIVELCKEYEVSFEAWGQEVGCCFQEHIIISNEHGEVFDSVEWYEFDLTEYDSKEDAEIDLGQSFTDEEFERGIVERGGYADYCEWNI